MEERKKWILELLNSGKAVTTSGILTHLEELLCIEITILYGMSAG
jgi:hypothetical protein